MIIGSHVGLKAPDFLVGSINEALSYNANALMLYTGAPQNTIRKPISELNVSEYKLLKEKHSLTVIVHAPYILNLASPDSEKRSFSIYFLKQELKRVEEIDSNILVLHPGNYMTNTLEDGLDLIVDSLNKVGNSNVKIAIETMAGKGSECCFKFEQIKYLMDHVEYPLYVCFDTCHTFDSGYDLVNKYDEIFSEFDRIIGLDKIVCFHINDSKNTLESHKDRHENIGKGNIGLTTLKRVVNDPKFINIPKILETPYVDGIAPYKEEIELLTK